MKMNGVNPWDRIFEEDFKGAYDIANLNYHATGDSFALRARAKSSYLLKDYQSAITDFLRLRDLEKETDSVSDDTYFYIAFCYYALGDNEKAIEFIQYPVKHRKEIKYTCDEAIHAALLYYFGLRLNLTEVRETGLKKLKAQKTTVPQYLLGQMPENEFEQYYKSQPGDILRNRKECKAEFYKSVLALAKGNEDRFAEHLHKCVNLRGRFLECEFYLARLELDRFGTSEKLA